jgi:CheY-like chemotaxis protein
MLEIIIAETKKANNFVEHILRFDYSFSEKEININELLKDIKKTFDQVKKSVKINLFLDEIPQIKANRLLLEQAILNIINNAVEAYKKATIFITTRRVIRDRKAYILIQITDNGPGIPNKIKAEIFKPGFSTKKPGRGFGLFTSKNIIEKLGGEIWVKNVQERAGTIFTIFIPVEGEDYHFEGASSWRRDHRFSILLVEDEDILRNHLEEFLSKGYRVFSANNMASALQWSEHLEELDFLITDIHLSDGKGTKLARLLKRKYPNLRIIFISGYAQIPSDLFSEAVLLKKPFLLKDLWSQLEGLREGMGKMAGEMEAG